MSCLRSCFDADTGLLTRCPTPLPRSSLAPLVPHMEQPLYHRTSALAGFGAGAGVGIALRLALARSPLALPVPLPPPWLALLAAAALAAAFASWLTRYAASRTTTLRQHGEEVPPFNPRVFFGNMLRSTRGFGGFLEAKRHLQACAWTALALGALAAASLTGIALGEPLLFSSSRPALYASALAAFHFLEFLWSATFEPRVVDWDAFLLNHSRSYSIAMVAAWSEYMLEAALLPSWLAVPLKTAATSPLTAVGLVLVIGGQTVRSLAMWTAGSNFTHWVAESKRSGHRLVRSGVYRWVRHPSYFGWFWWTLGTQLLLGNPLCLAGYAGTMILFFRARLDDEERALLSFFGAEYLLYAAATPTGIPFVGGLLPYKGKGLEKGGRN